MRHSIEKGTCHDSIRKREAKQGPAENQSYRTDTMEQLETGSREVGVVMAWPVACALVQ